MSQFNDEERALYAESRALKFKAREMRKKRIEKEQNHAKERQNKLAAEAVIKAREEKEERDARIKRALLAFMNALKAENLALLGYGMYGEKKHVLTIADTKKTYGMPGTTSVRSGVASPSDVNVRLVSGKGFEWD